MQEAKFSINVRFNYKGYDTQFTMRDDENAGDLIERFLTTIAALEGKGATPARRWEEVKGAGGNGNNGNNSKTQAGSSQVAQSGTTAQALLDTVTTPVCRHCDSAAHMELVRFHKSGVDREEWKCQSCEKWHYDKAPR